MKALLVFVAVLVVVAATTDRYNNYHDKTRTRTRSKTDGKHRPVYCPKSNPPVYGSIQENNAYYHIGSIIHYSCNYGYELYGSSWNKCVYEYGVAKVASQEAGAVADQAEKRKSDKYSNMDPNMYLFAPVVIETSGVFGKQTLSFLKDLACRVRKVSGEVKSFSYLLQRFAVAVQRGNAVSVLGTFASEDCLVFEDSDAYY
ncbi:hypothetical protein EMCRGX_G008227 [Ephydatia muelleri]